MVVNTPIRAVNTDLILPDYKTALVDYLRAHPEMVDWAGGDAQHITAKLRDVTGGPANWLAIVLTGGWGKHMYVPRFHAFVTMHFYGKNGYEAMKGYRIASAILDSPSRRNQGFTRLGCVFYDFKMGMPNEFVDPGTEAWEKRVAFSEAWIREVQQFT